MRSKRLRIIVSSSVLAVLMGSGCAATGRGGEPHQQWIGQPAHELVDRWGLPAVVERTADGGWTLEFQRQWRSHAPGYGYVVAGRGATGAASAQGSARGAGAGVVSTPTVASGAQGAHFPIGVSCRAQVAVDRDGRIARIETRGKACRSMA